jgi:membrane protein DedA with SNARE-associated domain
VSRNAVKLLAFFIAEGIVIAAGVGVLVAVHASDIWWTAWMILALFMGSFVGSFLLFPGKVASQPVQQPAERREQEMQVARQYNLLNIRLRQEERCGFSGDGG